MDSLMAVSTEVSDRVGEFGECGGDLNVTWGFGGDFVVAAAEILQEGEPTDDHLSGAVGP
jgi:hypothetical protein